MFHKRFLEFTSSPTSGFEWLAEKQIHKLDIRKLNIDDLKGLDLEVPEHLHDLHNNYPLASEILNRCFIRSAERAVSQAQTKFTR